jgi:hypothetical protein
MLPDVLLGLLITIRTTDCTCRRSDRFGQRLSLKPVTPL